MKQQNKHKQDQMKPLIFDLDFQIKWLDDSEVPGDRGHAGKLVGAALAGSTGPESQKLAFWGAEFFNKRPVEMDATDKLYLIGTIESSQMLTALVKSQVVKYLRSVV